MAQKTLLLHGEAAFFGEGGFLNGGAEFRWDESLKCVRFLNQQKARHHQVKADEIKVPQRQKAVEFEVNGECQQKRKVEPRRGVRKAEVEEDRREHGSPSSVQFGVGGAD